MDDDLKLKSIAEDYFASKSCKTRHKVLFNDPENGMDYYLWENLSEDEVEAMKATKKEKGIQYLLNHLEEVIENEDARHDIFPEGMSEIELENPVQVFTVRKHYLMNNDEVSSWNKDIIIKPEDYVQLLTLFLYDKNMNFNKLRYAAPQVFEKILREVDEWERDNDTNCYHCEEPYFVTSPEVKEAVKNIYQNIPKLSNQQDVGIGSLIKIHNYSPKNTPKFWGIFWGYL